MLGKIVKIIKEGGIIITPTDTVYGLICNPFHEKAIDRIFAIKQRDKQKTIPLLVDSIKTAEKIGQFNGVAKVLAQKHWPGAFTIIVCSKDNYHLDERLQHNSKIALRMPNAPFLQEIITECGGILAATSANISGENNYDLDQIKQKFSQVVDYIIDTPTIAMSMHGSTIVDASCPIGIKVIRNSSSPHR